MPVLINLTTAEHGGTKLSCGTHEGCGVNCDCGCPYTGMEEKGRVEPIAEAEARYPGQWLAFVIPPGEDDYAPERGMLVAYGDEDEVFEAVARVTFNQVVHVYFNGPLEPFLELMEAA